MGGGAGSDDGGARAAARALVSRAVVTDRGDPLYSQTQKHSIHYSLFTISLYSLFAPFAF